MTFMGDVAKSTSSDDLASQNGWKSMHPANDVITCCVKLTYTLISLRGLDISNCNIIGTIEKKVKGEYFEIY